MAMAAWAGGVADPSGNPADFVKLVSGDGLQVVLPRAAARWSKMIAALLDGIESLPNGGGFGLPTREGDGATAPATASGAPPVEPPIPVIHLQNINGRVLSLIANYLIKKMGPRSCESIEFEQLHSLDSCSSEDQQLVVDLLVASDYLDC